MGSRMTGGDRSSEFGPRLRGLREQRAVSLRHIAERTKISVGTLEALERDDIGRLPGGIFSRAMVRAYAHEIGADPEAIVREFVSRFPVESVSVGPGSGGHDATLAASRFQRGLAIAAAILLPLVAIFLWFR